MWLAKKFCCNNLLRLAKFSNKYRLLYSLPARFKNVYMLQQLHVIVVLSLYINVLYIYLLKVHTLFT